jgi:bacterial leucyl aminopeptidase
VAVVLGAALILSYGCGPTVVGDVDEEEADGATVWLTVGDPAVPEVEDYLGPISDEGGSRVVDSANGASILLAHESELEPLAAWFHDRFHRCGGFATHTSLEAARDAITAQPGDTALPDEPPGLLTGEPAAINRMLPVLDKTRILATVMGLSSFPTRYYTSSTGVDAANWLRDRWTALAAGRSDVTVELVPHAGWAQPSVMMTIQGQDLPAEYVVVGGHLDSITFSGATAPGADDDASGVATLTEVARVILADGVKLRRSVVFIAYAAEEVGLRGSNEIADQWAAEGRVVRGVMQLDMTDFKGSAADIVLFTDYTSPTLTDALEALAGNYLPDMVISRDACGYACSDHAPWFQNGFPTVLPFESQMDDYNPNIHTSGDTLAFLGNNMDHALKFSKLGLAWVVQRARVFAPASGVVRLAQVAYDAPGVERDGELVELYNTGSSAIDVGGWTLSAAAGSRALPAGTSVPAGGWLTLGRNQAGFIALYGQAPDVSRAFWVLANTTDTLTLRNAAGTVVDKVAWGLTGWDLDAAPGQSLVRTQPAGPDTDTVTDWSIAPADPH